MVTGIDVIAVISAGFIVYFISKRGMPFFLILAFAYYLLRNYGWL